MRPQKLVPLLFLIIVAAVYLSRGAPHQPANSFEWMGRTWTPSNGRIAGIVNANPENVSIDSNGYLHLRIVNRDGAYTAAEVFTTDNLGFGTYQWQIEGAIDKFDPTTVLGLFNYGAKAAIGVDAENEIDIEFSQWNNTCHGCNADFTFYPSTGNKSLGPMEDNFTYNPNGSTLTTARFEWSSTKIVATIMSGLQPLGTTANVLHSYLRPARLHCPYPPSPSSPRHEPLVLPRRSRLQPGSHPPQFPIPTSAVHQIINPQVQVTALPFL
jgi:hypothetical protein